MEGLELETTARWVHLAPTYLTSSLYILISSPPPPTTPTPPNLLQPFPSPWGVFEVEVENMRGVERGFDWVLHHLAKKRCHLVLVPTWCSPVTWFCCSPPDLLAHKVDNLDNLVVTCPTITCFRLT